MSNVPVDNILSEPRSKVKLRSHYDTAELHPLRLIPGMFELLRSSSCGDLVRTRFQSPKSEMSKLRNSLATLPRPRISCISLMAITLLLTSNVFFC